MGSIYQTIKTRHFVFWAIITVFCLLIFVPNTFACECVPLKSMPDELSNSELVFIGKVLRIKTPKSAKLTGKSGVSIEGQEITGIYLAAQTNIRFKVIQKFKGTFSSQYVMVATSSGCCDCGFLFEKNTEYLVYAYKNKEGRLETSVCTRTKLKNQAEEELKQLQTEEKFSKSEFR